MVTANSEQLQRRQDWLLIVLIGAIHGSSHFFQLVFPTLFLYLSHAFGFDYLQLGFLVTAFFFVSGVGQASSGFVVDRIGAMPVLHFGLLSFVVSGALIAASQNYWMLFAAAIIGGAGNSVFHPVDYSIINERVSPERLGHAFSVHGLTGNLGWALAPVFITTISMWAGWRAAALGAGLLVLVIYFFALLGRNLLSGAGPALSSTIEGTHRKSAAQEKVDEPAVTQTARSVTTDGPVDDLSQHTVWETVTAIVKKPALWGAFLFFAFSSVALSAVQNYTIPLMSTVYKLSEMLSGLSLSAYMLTAAVGMIAGGFLAGASARSERIVFVSLVMAGLLLLLLAFSIVPGWAAISLVALAGFCSGVAAPSRDMLIRRVAPKGATGTIYGLVYSGMDVGASIAPAVFGYLVDAKMDRGPWYGAALAFTISALMAVYVAYAAQQQQRERMRPEYA